MSEIPMDTRTFNNIELISVQRSNYNNTPYHRHNFLEMSYVTSGSAVHYFNNESVTVKKGDYFAVNYDEIHKFSPNGDDNFEVINILFKPEFIDPSLKDCRGFPDLVANASINFNYFTLKTQPTSVIYHDKDDTVLAIFNNMLYEYQQKNIKYQELIRCYLTELIIITLRQISKNVNTMENSDKSLNRLLDYVNQNYMHNIKLKDISDELGYTPSYLSSMFTSKLGIPFSKYLQNIRLAHACDLLANTQDTIETIAEKCSYTDIKFFRRVFKCKLNMSPSEFRKMSHNCNIL